MWPWDDDAAALSPSVIPLFFSLHVVSFVACCWVAHGCRHVRSPSLLLREVLCLAQAYAVYHLIFVGGPLFLAFADQDWFRDWFGGWNMSKVESRMGAFLVEYPGYAAMIFECCVAVGLIAVRYRFSRVLDFVGRYLIWVWIVAAIFAGHTLVASVALSARRQFVLRSCSLNRPVRRFSSPACALCCVLYIARSAPTSTLRFSWPAAVCPNACKSSSSGLFA
mmetsp:Transcript_18694/g.41539  ORF Transcript_18694/g.41539 Transcript_18694/m.41539 type:complete len:222 (+) Transcript_18694:21-686(+)